MVDADVARSAARSIAAVAFMTVAVLGVSLLVPSGVQPAAMLVALAAKVAAGAAAFLIAARLLGMPEFGWAVGRRSGA